MALVLTDQTANGNTLTNHNTVAASATLPFTSSNINAAAFTAASSMYLDAADSASLSITGNMTLMGYFRFASLPSDGNRMYFMTKRLAAGNQRSYTFYIDNTGGIYTLQCGISTDGIATTTASVAWTPSTSTYYNAAVVYTAAGGTADFYINAVQQGAQQSGLATSIFDSTALFTIGNQGDLSAGQYFDGIADDLRVYNTARTGAAIAADYNHELRGNEAGLVAYWPFEIPVFGGFLALL